ncbi:hypothetical protein IPZ58_05250 [Streptomyces roseoverticillatus]|uniref:hypothetical protein n=1 Tax=Streptomyces roseoverticillatus TaxID=66429 RepID=UPI001F308738|nr:hypothetical protein [Streptomyces roseoverticillatus]MCF3100981.1 hypothetical protein [Streptomyces roseoverticillatus]
MGLMKRFLEDRDTIRELARHAAQHVSARDRMKELDQVFATCGDAAKKYAQPEAVTRRLVGEAVDEYRVARRQLRGTA